MTMYRTDDPSQSAHRRPGFFSRLPPRRDGGVPLPARGLRREAASTIAPSMRIRRKQTTNLAHLASVTTSGPSGLGSPESRRTGQGVRPIKEEAALVINEQSPTSRGPSRDPGTPAEYDGYHARSEHDTGANDRFRTACELDSRWGELPTNETANRSAAAEYGEIRCIHLGGGIRLQLREFADGWGWHAWEEITRRSGWQPCRPPVAQDVARRFDTPAQAAHYFGLLARLSR
jgi:hypothetical protein